MVKTASLYDKFCKTGNYVIYDVIIWVQDGNCKRWLKSRGVATAGDTGDASPVRPTMSPFIKVTTDSSSSELTFDE